MYLLPAEVFTPGRKTKHQIAQATVEAYKAQKTHPTSKTQEAQQMIGLLRSDPKVT